MCKLPFRNLPSSNHCVRAHEMMSLFGLIFAIFSTDRCSLYIFLLDWVCAVASMALQLQFFCLGTATFCLANLFFFDRAALIFLAGWFGGNESQSPILTGLSC